jgi:hypothetical protein
LRGAGAASVLNGAWLLPRNDEHAAFLSQLTETVRGQDGTAVVFVIQEPSPTDTEGFVARFRADRGREYDELGERCHEFLAEIEKEKQRRKLTFAELEEIEDDLGKLTAWLVKIRARDFFPSEQSQKATATLDGCGAALRAFAEAVYTHEGIGPLGDQADEVEGPT